MKDFLELFTIPDTKMGIVSGSFDNIRLYDAPPDEFRAVDTYFTPAQRKPGTVGHEKSDVAGSVALWVDIDVDTRFPQPTLPPTIVVHSGHGYHVYWLLDEPLTDLGEIETLNKLLEQDIPESDKGVWNANRWMRVPGTPNTEPPAALARVVQEPNGHRYSAQDIKVLANLSKKARGRIQSGDSRGFKSRSERDWFVVRSLLQAGASEELILHLYNTQPVGNKADEAHESYLPRTIAKVRESLSNQPDKKNTAFTIAESENGYVGIQGDRTRQLSTFTLHPTVFLDGGTNEIDALVCDVNSQDGVWNDVTFSRKAFTSVRNFDNEAPIASWQFLGSDSDIRKLLPHLLEGIRETDAPRISAVSTMGLHYVDDEAHFVGDNQTLSAHEVWNGYNGPLVWLPSKKEHPSLDLLPGKPDLPRLRELVPNLNIPQAIWPLIGWYAASPLKPWLEAQGYRFPILHVTGPRGSGKTTLIQRVFMPLFGQHEPKSYDAGTTRFVALALLGSSNAVPIAFSEFRYASVQSFLRYVLLAYDTGHDPRGRPDQTTVDYPLSAPFSLDGEDKIVDPAALQRLIVVHLRSNTIEEGSNYYDARQALTPDVWEGFGGYYIQSVLRSLAQGDMNASLVHARAAVLKAFPHGLPDRVRNNLTVAYLGMMLWSNAVQMAVPDASILSEALQLVHPNKGRGRMLADDWIEDIVNHAAQGGQGFYWEYDGKMLWFTGATAHPWWSEQQRRRGRDSLERESLLAQFPELGYITEVTQRDNRWAYGVDVEQAYKFGLDIPRTFSVREVHIKF